METLPELIPNEEVEADRVFATPQEYRAFRKSYAESVRSKMEESRRARLRSEERAKSHSIR